MKVNLVLGNAAKFSAYNMATNTFRVLGSLLAYSDRGDYPIQVVVALTNSKGTT